MVYGFFLTKNLPSQSAYLSYFVMTSGLKTSKIKASYCARNSVLANSLDPADQDVKNGAALANMSSWA